jgi:ribose transport system permease protein
VQAAASRDFQASAGETQTVWRTLLTNRALTLLILVLLISAIMTILFPTYFFNYYNLRQLLFYLATPAILTVGMMMLIVAGMFDLSIGGNLAMAGAITAAILLVSPAFPYPLAIAVAIVISTCAGVANGLLVAFVGVNALITTLAMMGILRGVAIMLAKSPIPVPQSVGNLGAIFVLGFQIPTYYMIGIVILGAFLLARTRYFRQLYYIGANRKAADLSGINSRRVLLVTFVISGFLAGFVGVVQAAGTNAAIGIIQDGIELKVITAVIIGGGSLSGGKGTILGAFMGALFMLLIDTIMTIASVNNMFQPFIIGIILVLAVTLDVVIQKRYGASR